MNIKEVLQEIYNYPSFRKGQEEIINEIVSGKNVLAILPTGAGKSLCYQIPAIIGDSFSIVISPLVALMKDQVDSLNQKKEIAAYINSSVEYFESEKILRKVNEGKIKLIYLAPEKLQNRSFAEKIKNLKPKYIFVDEAHCISEWGHNFRPSYRKIIQFAEFVEVRKISAFTATATPEVREDIIGQLKLEDPKVFVRGFERDNLHLNVIQTSSKKETLPDLIKKFGTPAIIYTATRKNAEEAVDFLKSKKMNAEFYHAGLSSEMRRMIQDDFLQDRLPVIAATNAFGMGIDKSDIRLIVHYNMPGTIENYYQEIGRAGRDGKDSHAFLLYEMRDRFIQEYFIRNSIPEIEQIKLIYDTIGNANSIAVGTKPENNILIDAKILKSLSFNKISASILQSGLRILEEAEYIKLNSDFEQNHFVRSALSSARLKKFLTNGAKGISRDVLLLALREKGKLFFELKVKIGIPKIARELKVSASDIIETLDRLSASGIVEYDKPSKFQTIKYSRERVESRRLIIDQQKLQRQMKHAMGKLDKMLDYVRSNECKFKFILDYFGENAPDYRCGKCENCKSFSYDKNSNLFIENKVVEFLNSINLNLSRKELVEYLKGRNQNQFGEIEEHFGCCSSYSKKEIETSVENLLFHGELIKRGEELITGENKLAEDKALQPQKETYEEKLELFNLLRIVRKEAAQRFSQPVKLICSDALLKEIAEFKPKTVTEFLNINGMNRRIFNKIGRDMMEAIVSFEAVSEEKKIEKNIPDDLSSTLILIKKKYSLEDIAMLRRVSETIISSQIEAILGFYPALDVYSLFDKDEFELIRSEISKGERSAKRLKEALPKDISYGKIKIALAKFE